LIVLQVFSDRALSCEHGSLHPLRFRTTVVRASMSIALFGGALSTGCNRGYGPDVVATVNRVPIQRSAVEKVYSEGLGSSKEQPTSQQAEAARLDILRQLIDEEMLQAEAKSLMLVASDEEVDARHTEVKRPYTKEEFDRKLQDSHMSLDDRQQQIRRFLTEEKLINKQVTSRINITDADIAQFYNANKAQFHLTEPKYDISEIVVASHAAGMAEASHVLVFSLPLIR
jgi:peptidyl-prolyl cis-trans isomerase SurA